MKLQKNYIALIAIAAVIIVSITIIEVNKLNRLSTKSNDKDVGISIGKTAPDFELETLDEKKAKLSDYRGKRVILNFWASWCTPCREEMPEFQKIYENNPDIVVLGVNLQENKEAIESFTNKLGIKFPILLDPNAQVKNMYNIFTQPVTYFIDKEGKITDKKFGALTVEEINQKIGNLKEEKNMQASNDEIKTLKDGTKYIIHPDKLMSGGPPKDGIPSIDNPKFISVSEANKFLNDKELVLGINLNGDKRAYPFQIMVWHEIVNDNVGGKSVAITYCPLCGTGITFDRTINGEAVEFGVSGLLYNSDLIMYDRKTDTLWQQVTGKAIIGKLTGMRLKQLPLDTLTWGEWKSLHPDTKVLSKETGFNRQYGRNPYGDYETSKSLYFPVENEDKSLHPKEVIYGIEIENKFKAYREEDLKKLKKIEDKIGGTNISIERSNSGIVKAINKDTNEEIVPVHSFWFAWFAFHPDTELYK
ncbi:DUF3179 domain-containing protein [Candidatus Woesearchaeota archaeon]|nr:DUF3179 domain-containing protein [Candidatus Woesearchaeota archaeon]